MIRPLLSNAEIKSLIECSKLIRKKPPKAKEKNRNLERRFSVYSSETNDEFMVFISGSVKHPNNFSIGLQYSDYLLFRCNGYHGTTRQGFYSHRHHAYPHCHVLTQDDLLHNRENYPSGIENAEGLYFDENTALYYFCTRCGILNYEEFLPEASQVNIFQLLKAGDGNAD